MLERELTAPRVQLTVGRGQFPRTRIGIVRDFMQYAPRVLHFNAFHSLVTGFSLLSVSGSVQSYSGAEGVASYSLSVAYTYPGDVTKLL